MSEVTPSNCFFLQSKTPKMFNKAKYNTGNPHI